MKPLTVALLFSLAATGAACSDPAKPTAEASAPAEGDPLSVDKATATSETQLSGTLNLNIGAQPEGSTRLLGSGGLGGSGESGVVLGSGGLGGGNFGESFDLGIDLNEIEEPAAPLSVPAETTDEDKIIRLPD